MKRILYSAALAATLAACGGGGGSAPPSASGAGGSAATLSAIGQNGTIDGSKLQANGTTASYPISADTGTFDQGVSATSGGLTVNDTAATGAVVVTTNSAGQVTSIAFHQDSAEHALLGLDGTTISNPQSVPKITADAISTAVTGAQGATATTTNTITEALNYSAFGTWATAYHDSTNPHDGTLQVGVFAGGSETPANAIPTTGSASYSGDAAGYASIPKPAGDQHTNGTLNMAFQGNAAIGINFGSQQVTTSFTNMQATSMDELATTAKLPDLSGSGSLTGAHYTTALSGGGLTGAANGALYGPTAQETAGTFNAAGGGTTITGGFVATH